MPRSRISSRQLGCPRGPGAAKAVRVPPWPSGLRATRPFSASRTRPVSRSTAGICPWTKRRPRSRPKAACAADQAVEAVEVDPLDLLDEPGPPGGVQVAPPAEQVLLAVPGQAIGERRLD